MAKWNFLSRHVIAIIHILVYLATSTSSNSYTVLSTYSTISSSDSYMITSTPYIKVSVLNPYPVTPINSRVSSSRSRAALPTYPMVPISNPHPVAPTYPKTPTWDPYQTAPTYLTIPVSGPHPIAPINPRVSTSDPYPTVPSPPPTDPAPESCPSISEVPPNSNPPEPASPGPYPSAQNPGRYRGIKAAYWPSFDEFPAASINTSYFTHIYYAFLLPEPKTFKLNVTQLDKVKIPELIHSTRAQNSPIKTLLSIGGWGNDPKVFSKMASTNETRAIFIKSTIEIAREYGFDGVDLDWEFPANDQDMSNLALLYRQWRKAINHEARITGNSPLLLTSAVYFSSNFTTFGEPISYPVRAITRYVNWISPMCFDYHGSWENFTGLHAALHDPNSTLSTSYGIGSWIQAGVPPRKLVMGLPLYGHKWRLQDPSVNGIGAPALGDGVLTYNQIAEHNVGDKAMVVFDGLLVAYYSYAGDTWIGYDDILSIELKVRFAKSKGLAGYFFWALGQDRDWRLSKQASIAWGRR